MISQTLFEPDTSFLYISLITRRTKRRNSYPIYIPPHRKIEYTPIFFYNQSKDVSKSERVSSRDI